MASPACTELEVVTMNWFGKLLGLPEVFLNCSDGPGGGVIQVNLIFIIFVDSFETFRILPLLLLL